MPTKLDLIAPAAATARPRPDAGNEAWFRKVLSHYPTGVSVITGISADRGPAGLVVGSFTSVSLEPPLVGFLPSARSTSWPRIRDGGSFCVNILAADQTPICHKFASQSEDKFQGVTWRPAPSGSPILERAVAWIDCEIDAEHPAGDHLIVVARVRHLQVERVTPSLIFFQGGYGSSAVPALSRIANEDPFPSQGAEAEGHPSRIPSAGKEILDGDVER